MSRLALVLLLVALPLASVPAQPQEGEARREALREQLASQRAALALIQSRKLSVLEGVELLQGMVELSRRRVRVLERELATFGRRVASAEREQSVLREALAELVQRLSPRLRVMYRMTRRRPLDVLLSARDFSALVWRSRALQSTVEGDLVLLRRVRRVATLQQQSLRELRRLRGSLASRHAFLQQQARLAQQQQDALEEVLVSLSLEADSARRMVRELERADAELGRVLRGLGEEDTADSGFGALKGQLPSPTQGVVEVGFGKVVNPRFNTVTLQKGLDIRAPAGTPVRAVAPGTVVFSDWLRGYGNLLILDHGDGYHSLMAHLAGLELQVGESVAAGQEVGSVGDSGSLKGAYLYFEIRRGGQAVDPAPWLLTGR